jgi:hypothetical protein
MYIAAPPKSSSHLGSEYQTAFRSTAFDVESNPSNKFSLTPIHAIAGDALHVIKSSIISIWVGYLFNLIRRLESRFFSIYFDV